MNNFVYHDIFATKGIEYILTIVFFLILIPFWILLRNKEKIADSIKKGIASLAEKVKRIPMGMYYARNHTWSYMQKSGVATVGLDDFLLHLTGDINVSFYKSEGDSLKQGEPMAELEKEGKKLMIYAPISGLMTEANNSLLDNSAAIIEDPYGQGWMCRIEPTNWKAETNQLYFAQEAQVWMQKEFVKLKDFLSAASLPEAKPGMLVLQDGGEIMRESLAPMSEDTWKGFQKEFLSL